MSNTNAMGEPDAAIHSANQLHSKFATELTEWGTETRQQQRHGSFRNKEPDRALPVINLPTDRPRDRQGAQATEVLSLTLDPNITERVTAFASSTGTSVPWVLMTAFIALLHRYTHQSDIPIATEISEKTQDASVEEANPTRATKIVWGDLSEAPTFATLIAQISQAQAHIATSVPLRTDKEQFRSQVCFRWLEVVSHQSRDRSDGVLRFVERPLGNQACVTAYDWDVRMTHIAQTVKVDWVYQAELFHTETIARAATHFQVLLDCAIATPHVDLATLSLLSEDERCVILAEWTATERKYPDGCVHEKFAERAARSPNAIAVQFENEHLTYAELNGRANQLARYLQTAGVGPDVLVGMCVERSLDMAVAALGIHKAGGAYVPLDPAYPKKRLAYILTDTQVPAIVTQTHLVDRLPAAKARVVCLDSDRNAIARHNDNNLERISNPEHLAYSIYTSGSTGHPKGVLVEHRALTNFVYAAIERYSINDRDRVLQFASLSFDAAFEEIYPCWIAGGTLVIRTDEMLASVSTFLEKCREYELTLLDLPTAYWHQLAFELSARSDLTLPDTLQSVIVGGEETSRERVALWHEATGDRVKLFNTYGPTETTVVATVYDVPAPELDSQKPAGTHSDDRKQSIPIGKPLGNVRAYVLNDKLNPVPIGISGELYVGGAGVARGYLNRPDLTAERFIKAPFDSHSDRLYKTGDLVRYLPDGNLEFLGRIDSQVKIRGFRVELGEVEAAITSHPDVRDAVAIARTDRSQTQSLVAYIVSNLIPERLPFKRNGLLEANGHQVAVRTEDISLTGASLTKVNLKLATSDLLRLHVLLPGKKEENCFNCEVAWVHQDRIGVRFRLTPHEQTAIHLGINHLLSMQGFVKTLQRTVSRTLCNYLKQTLPDYMVPTRFVLMKALPLTSNGKLDRRQLADPEGVMSPSSSSVNPAATVTEEIVMRLWSELLGVGVERQDNFFELGGHSLLVTQLIFRIQETFGVELPARTLINSATVASLAAAIDALKQSDRESIEIAAQPTINFAAEANLDSAIQPEYGVEPKTIFLTGSTGFLGRYLLCELLEQTSAIAHCLVRASDPEVGMQRLKKTMSQCGIWKDSYERRIIPIPGDLSQPQFGLSDAQFSYLARTIDVIYHVGALVNFSYPYAALKATNVGGTESVLRLAARTQVKPLHHISTLSVFDSLGYYDGRTILEDEPLRHSEGLLSGYAQSKWVAEKLVMQARDRGLPVSIYRPAEVGGHQDSGHWNRDDYICRTLKGCIQIGLWPDLDIYWHLTPVDYTSQAIVQLSRQPGGIGKAYHISNPHRVSMQRVFEFLRDRGGYSLECVSFPRWQARLLAAIRQSEENALTPMLTFFTEIVSPKRGYVMQQMHTEGVAPVFDCRQAENDLRSTELASAPAIDEQLLHSLLNDLSKQEISNEALLSMSMVRTLSCPPNKLRKSQPSGS